MTGNVATRQPESAPSPAEADLVARVREARARLDPPAISLPAPRSPDGVVPPASLRPDTDAPSQELLAEFDGLAEALAAVEADDADAPQRVLCRIAVLVADGVPEAGWSAAEELDVEVLRATSDAADELHGRASQLLSRLDEEERHGPAAALGSLVTTLRVVRVVADLELFERARR